MRYYIIIAGLIFTVCFTPLFFWKSSAGEDQWTEHDAERAQQDAQPEWEFRKSTDEMTGQTVTKLVNEQFNGHGVMAGTEASCVKDGKDAQVTFIATIVDDAGNGTVKLTGWQDKNVYIRYRQNDKVAMSLVPLSGNFNNQFLVFDALNEAAAASLKKSPYAIGLWTYAITGGLLVFGRYENVHLVKAEFQTDQGTMIVTIDTNDPNIQKMYQLCFRSNP
jgi:hypothetical protein